jgi:hypothetical protein
MVSFLLELQKDPPSSDSFEIAETGVLEADVRKEVPLSKVLLWDTCEPVGPINWRLDDGVSPGVSPTLSGGRVCLAWWVSKEATISSKGLGGGAFDCRDSACDGSGISKGAGLLLLVFVSASSSFWLAARSAGSSDFGFCVALATTFPVLSNPVRSENIPATSDEGDLEKDLVSAPFGPRISSRSSILFFGSVNCEIMSLTFERTEDDSLTSWLSLLAFVSNLLPDAYDGRCDVVVLYAVCSSFAAVFAAGESLV